MKRLVSSLLVSLFAVGTLVAGGVKVSERFGYDPVDATASLQAALDSGLPEIIIDAQQGPWYSRPLKGSRSNMTIVFEKGAYIRAKRGEFHPIASILLEFRCCTNIVLRGPGGDACGLRMWRDDYDDRSKYAWSEWRHALALRACVNVTLEGVGFTESGGDGLYLAMLSGLPTRNVTVRNCLFDRNYRQGISVIAADGFLVEDTRLTNTKGTPPAAGIDFEPNHDWEPLKNIVLRRCLISGNEGCGILVAHQNFTGDSDPISIRVEDCRVMDSGKSSLRYATGTTNVDVPKDAGTIVLRNCLLARAGDGISLRRRANCTGGVAFENVVIEDSCQQRQETSDIHISVSGHVYNEPDFFTFTNVTVRRAVDRPAISWSRRDTPYVGRPTRVDGELRVETAGRVEKQVLDEAWRNANFPFTSVPKSLILPTLPRVQMNLKGAKVTDKAPGQMLPCAPVFVRGHQARYYVFHAARPGEVHFHFVQTLIGKGKYSNMKPIDICAHGNRRCLARFEAPQAEEGCVLTFVAPKAGFYDIDFSTGGNGLALVAADVPVALHAFKGDIPLVAPKRSDRKRFPGPDDLIFRVTENVPFECQFISEGAETFSAEVIDPQGVSVWRADVIADFDRCQPKPQTGLWTMRIGPPKKGVWEDHKVALRGIPCCLFLTAGRYW